MNLKIVVAVEGLEAEMARKMSKADEYLLRSWYPVLFSSYIDISLDILINGAIGGIIRKANP